MIILHFILIYFCSGQFCIVIKINHLIKLIIYCALMRPFDRVSIPGCLSKFLFTQHHIDLKECTYSLDRNSILYITLEGMAVYGCLLLAPAEGWCPSATWRVLRALFSFRCSVLKLQRSYTPSMDSGEL